MGGDMAGWTYIMTNKPRGVLYIGVAALLGQRAQQHRDGKGSKFCAKYNLKLLVLAEHHDTIDDAIRREKLLKEWKRAWKIELIERFNPEWRDLFDEIRE
jgi:putative endonuclease